MKYFDERLIHPAELGMVKEWDRMWIERENDPEWEFVHKDTLKNLDRKTKKYIKDLVPIRKGI